jgi:hypothetical protein
MRLTIKYLHLKRIRRHLILLGPAFIVSVTLMPAEASQAATISNPARATVTATDPQPSNSDRAYTEDYQAGYGQGIEQAKQLNCLRSPAWRPRAWWGRQSQFGYFDGSEAAYDSVCGVNRPTEKAQIP